MRIVLSVLAVVFIQTVYFGWFWVQFIFIIVYGIKNPAYLKRWLKQLGMSQAQSGNAQMYPTLNLFVKGDDFGKDIDESISHVSGVVKHEGRYKYLGRVLSNAHNWVYKVLGLSDNHLEEARKNAQ